MGRTVVNRSGLAAAWVAAACLLLCAAPALSHAARVKDMARVDGVRKNQLLGYGLVVGLNGTGDKQGTEFTTQTTANLLERLGVVVSPRDIKLKNVAAVMVTADLPPFSRAGQRLDVTISSLGDATSLFGGTLLLTPLRASNGDVYAVAQGALVVGGYAAESKGSDVQKNHPTVGRIASGAILERDAPAPDLTVGHVDLVLEHPDFTTSARLARAVGRSLGEGIAHSLDAGRVRVTVPQGRVADPVGFLAELESLTVETDGVARVVVDEKVGTVVLGQEVTLKPVAISHGNLTVKVTPYLEVSQPEPNFGVGGGGRTVARDRADVATQEGEGKVALLEQGQDLASLVRALNSLGVSPRDLVSIFQTLKAAGALEAELEVL
ncbi:MAG: flagellar basal body P-ring protein FlgI [Proteobacteria bacterium]|nr:flagellar basal body P-ring protein FlgI [Pseudomonadota bacterium]